MTSYHSTTSTRLSQLGTNIIIDALISALRNIISFFFYFTFLSHFISRVSQYVFVPSDDTIFQQLDQHADTLEGDVAPPFVLVGNEGEILSLIT